MAILQNNNRCCRAGACSRLCDELIQRKYFEDCINRDC